jgi:hypothetical protein
MRAFGGPDFSAHFAIYRGLRRRSPNEYSLMTADAGLAVAGCGEHAKCDRK